MSTILLAWELGGGLGHLTMLDPVARELIRRGHRVVAALRDLSRAEEVFAGSGVEYLQSPLRTRRISDPFPSPCTFAHILHNIGLSNLAEMRALLGAWQTIYRSVRPDLVLFEHAPTALLASVGEDFTKVAAGTGFVCPPDVSPLPDWRPWRNTPRAQLAKDEQSLLVRLNQLLDERAQPPLERVAQLYTRDVRRMLMTLPELDHYGDRPGAEYFGCWPGGRGIAPDWPSGSGLRIFAYVKPFAALPALLQQLADWQLPTLVHCDSVNPDLQRQLQTTTLRFTAEPIELNRAGEECDLAIVNATHGVTAAMFLAGKPMLAIPLYLEQHLMAQRMADLGTTLIAPEDDGAAVVAALKKFIDGAPFDAAAAKVAGRYPAYDGQQRVVAYVDRLETILEQP